MHIQIDGTGMVNKGAELMLYAILQELERQPSNFTIDFNGEGNCREISTTLHLNKRLLLSLNEKISSFHLPGILRRLGLPYSYLTTKYPSSHIDLVIDAGGFQFSDQFNMTENAFKLAHSYYRGLKKNGSKVIFLPQSFGPFKTKMGKQIVQMLNEFADLIFARDSISLNYLKASGIDESKVKLYPDFTSLVKPNINTRYNYLSGAIAVVPNCRILDKTNTSTNNYLSFMVHIIKYLQTKQMNVFLLNHEGIGDLMLCNKINGMLSNKIDVISGLNALEIKGIISQCYFTISSRYHGVANALSSGVPCLATSWSHKYEELFKDYNQNDCLLDISNPQQAINKVSLFMDLNKNNEIRNDLNNATLKIKQKNIEMWDLIWNYVQNN